MANVEEVHQHPGRELGWVSSVPAAGPSNLFERSLAALGCRSQVSRSSASGIRPN